MVLSDESLVTPIKGATKQSLDINMLHSVFYPTGTVEQGGQDGHVSPSIFIILKS